MKKVLISAPYMHKDKEKISEMLSNEPLDISWAEVQERLDEDELLPIIDQFDGIICGDDSITQNVVNKAKGKLKVVVKWGTGIDSIDQQALEKAGIPLYNTPNAFTEPVADTTIALILAFSRNIIQNDLINKSGDWSKPDGFTLSEKTVGIIGFGNIGKAVAKRLSGFNTKVWVYDIKEFSKATYREHAVEYKPLDEIIKKANFITLHTDLNPTSLKLLNGETFSIMKQKPVIINTARGPLIEETALVEALKNDIIQGAGLDVFEHEPLAQSSYLRSSSKTILSSHNSNSSPFYWDKVHINSINKLKQGLGIE